MHIPRQSAIHLKWDEPAHCQKKRIPFHKWETDQSAKVSNRCYNKTVSQQRGLGLHRHWLVLWWFWSFADKFSISVSLWWGSPLVIYVECCVCRPVGSQPAAKWMRTDSPCVWPIVPSPGLGLERFLLAAPGAAAWSKTSLLGCCRPSVCPRCSGRPSPRHCSYVAWAAALCCVKGWCTELPHGDWNHKNWN